MFQASNKIIIGNLFFMFFCATCSGANAQNAVGSVSTPPQSYSYTCDSEQSEISALYSAPCVIEYRCTFRVSTPNPNGYFIHESNAASYNNFCSMQVTTTSGCPGKTTVTLTPLDAVEPALFSQFCELCAPNEFCERTISLPTSANGR